MIQATMKDTADVKKRSLSENSKAKRRKMTGNKSLKDLPSDQFASNLSAMDEYFKSPKVIVKVEDKEYGLPKNLLCDASSFFDRAFNGNFKEGNEQRMELKETTKTCFELAIQWMLTGKIVLPETCETNSETITQLVGFLKFADLLPLSGPFDFVVAMLRNEVVARPDTLSAQHIREVVELPRDHALRQLFAEACVRPYLTNLKEPTPFKFQAEVDDSEAFASDMHKAVDAALKNAVVVMNGRRVPECRVPDPIGGDWITLAP